MEGEEGLLEGGLAGVILRAAHGAIRGANFWF